MTSDNSKSQIDFLDQLSSNQIFKSQKYENQTQLWIWDLI